MLGDQAWLVSESQRCWMGLRSGLFAGQSSSSKANRETLFFLDQEGTNINCCHKIRSTLTFFLLLSQHIYIMELILKSSTSVWF